MKGNKVNVQISRAFDVMKLHFEFKKCLRVVSGRWIVADR